MAKATLEGAILHRSKFNLREMRELVSQVSAEVSALAKSSTTLDDCPHRRLLDIRINQLQRLKDIIEDRRSRKTVSNQYHKKVKPQKQMQDMSACFKDTAIFKDLSASLKSNEGELALINESDAADIKGKAAPLMFN